jgi:hypothetical protein
MGCGGSSPTSEPAPQPAEGKGGPSSDVQVGVVIENGGQQQQGAPPPKKGKGKGKGKKGKGKGKGRGDPAAKDSKFQVMLEGNFKDYGASEDALLKRAYMLGNTEVAYDFRGQHYKYNFKDGTQYNKKTNKSRQIRKPKGYPNPPKASLLPTGPMIVLVVKEKQPGQVIQVQNPNNKSQTIPVYVPPHAAVGSKMAIPLPKDGETVEDLQAKQKQHDAQQGWSKGGKIALSGAALLGVGAVGVGGVLLGDHLAGGDMADTVASTLADTGEDVGDWVEGAGEDIGDWAVGAGEDIGEWAPDAIDDAGEWMGEAGGDAIDWLGDAGEDISDVIMDLF